MSLILKKKMILFSIFGLLLGGALGAIETVFYQYVNDEGVLVESFFMPLSILSLFLGGAGLVVAATRSMAEAIRS
jgi:hypothetical protein